MLCMCNLEAGIFVFFAPFVVARDRSHISDRRTELERPAKHFRHARLPRRGLCNPKRKCPLKDSNLEPTD